MPSLGWSGEKGIATGEESPKEAEIQSQSDQRRTLSGIYMEHGENAEV